MGAVGNLKIKTGLSATENRADVLYKHLRTHRISDSDLATISEGVLMRLPLPPDGWAFYELPDTGRRSVAGVRIRKGRRGVSFVLTSSIKQADETFKNAQFVLGKWKPDGSGMSLIKARDEATARKAQLRSGIDPRVRPAEPTAEEVEAAKPVTLRAAFDLYKTARTGKKKKKPLAATTLAEYTRVVDVSLRQFADLPLQDLGGDPRKLVRHFNDVGESTPAEANTQMRVMRAVWNRAHKVMPAKVPPAPAIWDMNEVLPRNAGFVTREIKSLWQAVNGLELMLARKAAFVLIFLGLREGGLLGMRFDDIDRKEKTLLIRTKGSKVLLLPLSDVILSLLLARTVENDFAGDNPYVFPSLRGPRKSKADDPAAKPGWRHIDNFDFSSIPPSAAYVEQKGEDASTHPHVFRHTYRTMATACGASEIGIRLLMGHSLQGDVSFDYLTADLDWLRREQNRISNYILKAAGQTSTFRFKVDAFR